MDLFDAIGPVMVGPSSSHTAGAARIGLAARKLLGEKPVTAELKLFGSFYETGAGHGTDRALAAGLLGLAEDDERLPDGLALCRKEGIALRFGKAELKEAHPNTVELYLTGESGKRLYVRAASLGGGHVRIEEVRENVLH